MLRHHDRIGLLRPVAVDARSGYRYYIADQLRRLNRVIALKDLGLTLAQVQQVLDDALDVAELRGMLRLRRAQLAADAARLTRIEENGWRAEGYHRELYVEYCADNPAAGVTELQQPVTRT